MIVLSLGTGGNRLVMSACPHRVPGQEERWFDVTIEAVGHPFAGKVEQIMTEGDLAFFRDNLARLTTPGEVVLGGERALELRLTIEDQIGGDPGRCVVEVALTPSGDDPYPVLRWLLHDQEPFATNAVAAIEELLGAG